MEDKKIGSTVDDATKKVNGVTSAIGARAHEVLDAASRTIANAGEKVDAVVKKGAHRIQESAQKASHIAEEGVDKASHAIQDAAKKVVQRTKS
jgi:hypothetical protein